MSITTLLIANRGEIAWRIIRTAHRMGMRCVAIYAEADRDAPYVNAADTAVSLGAGSVAETYLAMEKVLNAMRVTGADAVHPGYGFLSENADFAQRVQAAGVIWVGPPVAAMHAMASKARAKQTLETKGVPMIPGYHGADQSDAELAHQAQRIGFPVLVKASSGGGGKGMKVVTQAEDLPHALAQARREALSAFGDDQLLLEKYLETPRHIEVQVMADQHGSVVSLFERDCSVQRRHQKVLEEAPAVSVPLLTRQAMWQAAETTAREIGYQGAGTVEFILSATGEFYFLEMNTRLQVEHPVTEYVTGLDLVEWQLRVAQGEPMSFTRPQTPIGHAIEARFYAEDPTQNFLPQAGQIHYLRFPEVDGLRVDSGVISPCEVSQYYDPMLAKIIVHAQDRATALTKLRTVLSATRCFGLTTNLTFLRQLLAQSEVQEGTAHTRWLDEGAVFIKPPVLQTAPIWAALATLAHQQQAHYPAGPWHYHAGWRMTGQQQWLFALSASEQVGVVKTGDAYRVIMTDHELEISRLGYQKQGAALGRLQAEVEGVLIEWDAYVTDHGVELDNGDRTIYVPWWQPDHGVRSEQEASGRSIASLPGTITAVYKQPGDWVEAGENIVSLEAMKMEMTQTAAMSGVIVQLSVQPGDSVAEGGLLFEIRSESEREPKSG